MGSGPTKLSDVLHAAYLSKWPELADYFVRGHVTIRFAELRQRGVPISRRTLAESIFVGEPTKFTEEAFVEALEDLRHQPGDNDMVQLDFCSVAGCMQEGDFRSVTTRLSYCKGHGKNLPLECSRTGEPITKPGPVYIGNVINSDRVREALEGKDDDKQFIDEMSNTMSNATNRLTLSRIREASEKMKALKVGVDKYPWATVVPSGRVRNPCAEIPLGLGDDGWVALHPLIEANLDALLIRESARPEITYRIRRNDDGRWEQEYLRVWLPFPSSEELERAWFKRTYAINPDFAGAIINTRAEREDNQIDALIASIDKFGVESYPGESCEECAEKPARPGKDQRFCSDPCWLKGARRVHKGPNLEDEVYGLSKIGNQTTHRWPLSDLVDVQEIDRTPTPLPCEGTFPEDLV